MAIHKEILDKYLLPFFLRGLQPELRSVIVHKSPPTLEIAIEEAEKHERYAEAFGFHLQRSINTVSGEESGVEAQQSSAFSSSDPDTSVSEQECGSCHCEKQSTWYCYNKE
jgi:hypothetical protein